MPAQSSPPAAARVEPFSVDVRLLPSRTLGGVRHQGPYVTDSALIVDLFGEVLAWAHAQDLLEAQSEFIKVYHDDPDTTPAAMQRISLGVCVPEGTETQGRIGVFQISAGHYVCARFEIDASDYPSAWRAVWSGWLAQSAWQYSAHGPCHERYLNDPKTHPQGKHLVEIRIPVQPH